MRLSAEGGRLLCVCVCHCVLRVGPDGAKMPVRCLSSHLPAPSDGEWKGMGRRGAWRDARLGGPLSSICAVIE